MSDQQQTQEQQIMRRLMIAFCDKGTSLLFDTNSFNNVTAFLDFLSRCWMKDIPPNHLVVERWYYHSDGSKITLLPWRWYYHGGGSKNQVQLKKLRIAKFLQKWKKKILLTLPWYYHSHGSSVILLASLWQYRGSTCT